MTNAEALKRSLKALEKTCQETDNFDHGGFASHDIMESIERRLREEFRGAHRC